MAQIMVSVSDPGGVNPDMTLEKKNGSISDRQGPKEKAGTGYNIIKFTFTFFLQYKINNILLIFNHYTLVNK